MYAIFRAKGMQFRAEPDATLRVPSLEAEPGDGVTFDDVLLAELKGKLQVGTPSLEGASVSAEVVRHGRGEKIVVFKRKRRKGYRRKQGHRQDFTEVKIVGIDVPAGAAKAAKKKTAAKAKPAEPALPADVVITDAARELAEAHGIEIGTIEGTGKDGRILKGDVDKAIKASRAGEEGS